MAYSRIGLRRYVMRLMTVIIVATLAACSSMLVGGGNSTGGQLGTDNRSPAQLQADNAISATIRSRYAADSAISRFNLGVDTINGVVRLSGSVDSFEVRDRAVGIARRTDGVRSVRNDISVNRSR